jgi:hypothetical protein
MLNTARRTTAMSLIRRAMRHNLDFGKTSYADIDIRGTVVGPEFGGSDDDRDQR